jgi:hypothetical protein
MQGPGVTCESDAMTDAWGNLHIDVVDDEIIVTLPLTSHYPPELTRLLVGYLQSAG